jgi:hypothetical protein
MGGGNVYTADDNNNRVLKVDFADAPVLHFAATAVGQTSTDSPQTATLVNLGNAALNIPVPNSGSNPSFPSGFTVDNTVASACPQMRAGSPSPGTLAVGASCVYSVSFSPQSSSDTSGWLALTYDAPNEVTPSYLTANIALIAAGARITPAITWATPSAINYGTALSGEQLNSAATVPGSFSYSPSAGTVLGVGSHTITTTFTPTDTADCSVVTASVTVVVNQSTPAITWATPAAITYGTGLSGAQLNASSPVAGNLVYSVAAGTVLTAGQHTLSVTLTPNDSTDYTSATLAATITVTQATPVVTWPNPAAITYGTALSVAQLNASATTPGTFIYAPAAGIVPFAGHQTLSVSFSPADTTDYLSATGSNSVLVNQATLAVTAASATRAYGAANPTFSVSIAGAVNNDTFTASASSIAGRSSAVGAYAIVPSVSGANLADYVVTPLNGTLPVTSATLTVVPSNATRVYGATNPTFGGAVSGALNGDTFTVTASTTATTTSPVGSYPITYTVAGANLADYTVGPATGTLAVTQATPAVTWATLAAIGYGTTLSAAQLNATASAAGTFVYSPAAGTVPGAGAQTLSVTFTPTDTTDYATPATSTVPLIVKRTPLAISANAAARVFGAANPTFAGLVTGVVNGDTFTESFSTTATAASGIGGYPIVPSAAGANLGDYTVTTTNGALTISKAPLTVVPSNGTRAYGAVNPALPASVTGAVNGDTFTITGSTSAAATSPVGTYPITYTVAGSDLPNYAIASTTGTLTITPAALSVVPANATRVYGAANPVMTGSVTGTLNGDTFVVTGAATATGTSAVGSYPITYTVAGVNLADYTVVSATGTLTVTQGTPTMTWPTPAAIGYGTALSAAQLNATASTAGTFNYTPAAGVVLPAGTVMLTAAFTPTDTTDYTSQPASNVTLTVNKAPLAIAANNTARVFGAANPMFSGSVNGAVNGDTFTASFSTSATPASIVGSYPIVPSVAGANLANYAMTPTNGALTITQAGTATTFALSNSNLKLTAMVLPLTSGTPTGTVGFYEGQTLVGTGTLTNNVASYTAATFPAGNVVVTAEYSGDANFTQSASPAILVLTVVPAQTAITVGSAGSVSDALSMTTASGFAGTLQFSCSGLPADATCNFSPASYSFTGSSNTTSVTMTVQTGVSARGGTPELFGRGGTDGVGRSVRVAHARRMAAKAADALAAGGVAAGRSVRGSDCVRQFSRRTTIAGWDIVGAGGSERGGGLLADGECDADGAVMFGTARTRWAIVSSAKPPAQQSSSRQLRAKSAFDQVRWASGSSR